MEHIAFWSRRIKLAVHVDMNGNVENIGIIVEGTLASISWRCLVRRIANGSYGALYRDGHPCKKRN
jgi:hypothetical protein